MKDFVGKLVSGLVVSAVPQKLIPDDQADAAEVDITIQVNNLVRYLKPPSKVS